MKRVLGHERLPITLSTISEAAGDQSLYTILPRDHQLCEVVIPAGALTI